MEILINPYNMEHIAGIQDVLPGASTKYVIDLILDSIVYEWGIKIPHSAKSTKKHKSCISRRHLAHIENYANEKHISTTIATNLLLNDYFSGQACEKSSNNAIFTTHVKESKTTCSVQPSDENPKPLRGNALLQRLKG